MGHRITCILPAYESHIFIPFILIKQHRQIAYVNEKKERQKQKKIMKYMILEDGHFSLMLYLQHFEILYEINEIIIEYLVYAGYWEEQICCL